MGSPRSFWFGGEVQFRILSQPPCYDPASACFIAWPLLPKSSKFNLLQKAKLGAEAHTHTHTHTHIHSLYLKCLLNSKWGKGIVRSGGLTWQTTSSRPLLRNLVFWEELRFWLLAAARVKSSSTVQLQCERGQPIKWNTNSIDLIRLL